MKKRRLRIKSTGKRIVNSLKKELTSMKMNMRRGWKKR